MVAPLGIASRLWMSCIFHSRGTTILAELSWIDWRNSATNHLSVSVFHVDSDQETQEIQWDLVPQLGIGSLGNDSQHSSRHGSNLGHSDNGTRDPLFQAPVSGDNKKA